MLCVATPIFALSAATWYVSHASDTSISGDSPCPTTPADSTVVSADASGVVMRTRIAPFPTDSVAGVIARAVATGRFLDRPGLGTAGYLDVASVVRRLIVLDVPGTL